MKWIVLVLFGWLSLAAPEAPSATLEGVVTHQKQAFEKVTVTLSPGNYSTQTDAHGHYRLDDIPPGTYTITFSHPKAKQEIRKGVKLWANRTTKLHLSLQLLPHPPQLIEAVEDAEAVSEPISIDQTAPQQQGLGYTPMKAGNIRTQSASMFDTYREEEGFNTEAYDHIQENTFYPAWESPLSTFSIDVDNAAYSNMRRFLTNNQKPPRDAIRLEELVNYFDYAYPNPDEETPFSVNMELADCPWNAQHKLVHIGLQGRQLDYENIQPSNLVFLIDVSGSMNHPKKLPLVKQSLNYLVDQLGPNDRIALAVYAGAAGLVLPSTPASDKATIKAAINNLQAGGSTAGGAGIRLAYRVATDNLIEEGNNRVIIATDGDFNVGQSSNSEMIQLMEEKRKSGVYITVMGFGMGNYKDSKMEKIAQYGNGNYFYIDREAEAQKVFGKDLRATLFTIAKDVKLQVEFNPALVDSYRLIGYENRKMDNKDFDDDKKDAGELGAGHTVTALYEIVPAKDAAPTTGLKYQDKDMSAAAKSGELLTLKLRYKAPDSDTSQLLSQSLKDRDATWQNSTDNFRWSAAVALFGMLLRDSEFSGDGTYAQVLSMARQAKGDDPDGLRQEFIDMAAGYINHVAVAGP